MTLFIPVVPITLHFGILLWIIKIKDHCSRYCMVDGFTPTYTISANHHKSNTTSDTSGVGTAYPSGALEFTPGFEFSV